MTGIIGAVFAAATAFSATPHLSQDWAWCENAGNLFKHELAVSGSGSAGSRRTTFPSRSITEPTRFIVSPISIARLRIMMLRFGTTQRMPGPSIIGARHSLPKATTRAQLPTTMPRSDWRRVAVSPFRIARMPTA